MSIFFISSSYFKTTVCEHSQLVLGLASSSLMMGVFRDTHYTVLTFDWQLTGYYASLNWIEALMDLCLKVLIMSIMAWRRWIRKQRTVGQGWSLDLGKGIVERLCIRGESAHLKVGEVIRPLGKPLTLMGWWCKFHYKIFYRQTEMATVILGTVYQGRWYRNMEKAWGFSAK